MHLSITHLATLLAVASSGSMTQASAQLKYSLSTVSGHICSLERQLGTRLVQRTAQGCTPTQDGAHVVRLASELLDVHDEIVASREP